jgi:tRNA(Ile)-lysidine synthase
MDAQRDAVAAVRRALHSVAAGTPVVLAVSGGPDSVGMARLVVAARPDLAATVVHVRHGLRDDAHDAEIAAAHAQALGLAWEIIPVSVVAAGTGPEDAARRARWEALAAAARGVGASVIATGHTADDQAETVLLNLARGTGLAGLAGMPSQRDIAGDLTVIRPVLGLRRSVVAAAAAASGLPVAHDPTNTDPAQRRSRARSDVLPRLGSLTGGGTDPVEALARVARHAARDNDYLDDVAAAALTRATGRWGPVHVLPVAVLDGAHAAIATRMVRLLARRAGGQRLTDAMVSAVLGLRDGHVAQLGAGLQFSRGGGFLAAGPQAQPPAARRLTGDAIDLPEIGLTLRREAPTADGVLPPWAPASAAAAVPAPAAGALLVRPRQPGDHIGAGLGTRSVARAMAAAGVPRIARDLVPVVADDHGVLWVPGVAVRAGAAGSRSLRLVAAGPGRGVE